MTAKEIKSILNENEKVTLILEDGWKLIQNKNSLLGNGVIVENEWYIEKYTKFETMEEGVRYFAGKIRYYKNKLKQKNIAEREVIEIKY